VLRAHSPPQHVKVAAQGGGLKGTFMAYFKVPPPPFISEAEKTMKPTCYLLLVFQYLTKPFYSVTI
jgi:hypothetical protein